MKRRYLIGFALLILVVLSVISYVYQTISNNIVKSSHYVTTMYYPDYPVLNLQGKSAAEAAMINRGAYLVKVGDCIACHTNTTTTKKAKPFAGGLAMETPFGTIYTPNITPDQTTGIGKWTDAQFIKAMHEGIAPTGEYYYPAFPFLYFNQVTTDDLQAIKAYLAIIPAVYQANRPNEMMWPFNWRFLQLGWRIMFFNAPAGPYQIDPKQSTQWNRGAYLVEGLGHCAMCHTPSHYLLTESLPLAAPVRKYNLTGADVQGYLAPNITKTNLGAISDEELVKIFTNAQLIGGGQIQGPMLEAVHDSLSHLTQPDLIAIATYLKSVESKIPAEIKVGAGADGAFIYNSYCSGCHAYGVGGAPKFGDAASWGPLARSGMEKLYRVAINGGGNMPAKGTCIHCSNYDIKNAVDYMVAATLPGKSTPSAPKALTGEQIYNANCSSCHSAGNKTIPQLGDQTAWKPIVEAGILKAYQTVLTGQHHHPIRGNCTTCSDEEILNAIKYMLQRSSNKNYILW